MLSWFLNMRIRTKVFSSFLLVTLILMVVILVIIQMVKNIEATTKRVVDLRTPTAQASLMMLNGMNHSLASLRAWIILGEDEFKKERRAAWDEQISPSLEKMQGLSQRWALTENLGHLKQVQADIVRFKEFQKEIEDIAQTEENTPGRKILFHQVVPLEKVVVNNLTRMLKLELKNTQTSERNGLASLMTDLEASTGLAIEKLEEYMLSGSPVFKEQFEYQWNKNNHQYVELRSRHGLFSSGQREALNRLTEARDRMGPLMQQIIRIRTSDEWNRANFLLKTKAAPLAASITHHLNEMVASQNGQLQGDLTEVKRQTHFLIVILVAWFILGGLLSGVLGATITRGISEPLTALDRVMSGLTRGEFRHDKIEIITGDELGQLVNHTNELASRLRQFRRHATNLLSGNLKVQEFDLEGEFNIILNDILNRVKQEEDQESSQEGQESPPSPSQD